MTAARGAVFFRMQALEAVHGPTSMHITVAPHGLSGIKQKRPQPHMKWEEKREGKDRARN